MSDVIKALMDFDLNDMTNQWMFTALLCFVLGIAVVIAYVSKYKEWANEKENNDILSNTIKELEAQLEAKRNRETEILENFGRKLSTLEKENGKYKDADEYSKIFVDKMVIPVTVKETVDMTEGTYAYFVDEEKKREFALHSSKKAVLKEIVDILADKEYIQWKNVYDERDLRYTITGKLLVLVDKEN